MSRGVEKNDSKVLRISWEVPQGIFFLVGNRRIPRRWIFHPTRDSPSNVGILSSARSERYTLGHPFVPAQPLQPAVPGTLARGEWKKRKTILPRTMTRWISRTRYHSARKGNARSAIVLFIIEVTGADYLIESKERLPNLPSLLNSFFHRPEKKTANEQF